MSATVPESTWGVYCLKTSEDFDRTYGLYEEDADGYLLEAGDIVEFVLWRGSSVQKVIGQTPSENGSVVQVVTQGPPAEVRVYIHRDDLVLLSEGGCSLKGRLDVEKSDNRRYTCYEGEIQLHVVPVAA